MSLITSAVLLISSVRSLAARIHSAERLITSRILWVSLLTRANCSRARSTTSSIPERISCAVVEAFLISFSCSVAPRTISSMCVSTSRIRSSASWFWFIN